MHSFHLSSERDLNIEVKEIMCCSVNTQGLHTQADRKHDYSTIFFNILLLISLFYRFVHAYLYIPVCIYRFNVLYILNNHKNSSDVPCPTQDNTTEYATCTNHAQNILYIDIYVFIIQLLSTSLSALVLFFVIYLRLGCRNNAISQ